MRGGKDTAVTRYLKSAQGTGGGSPKAVPEGKKYALVVIYSICFLVQHLIILRQDVITVNLIKILMCDMMCNTVLILPHVLILF